MTYSFRDETLLLTTKVSWYNFVSVEFYGEIELPKGVEMEPDLPNLHAGQYNIAIEIAGSVFIGDFFVE